MNLLQTISLYFGGQGSGCHGPNCGRPSQDSLDRSKRATDTYVPMTKEKYGLSKVNEYKIAKLVGGQAFPGHQPFDVIIQKYKIGIEVKTIDRGKNDKLTVHPGSRVTKENFAKHEGLKQTYTIGLDHRGCTNTAHEGCVPTVYIKEGVGAFRLGNMTKLSNISEICQHIRCGD